MTPSLEAIHPLILQYVAPWVDDADDRADVAQLCLIKVWRRLHTFRGESAFDSWLFRVVRNEVVSWARREARRERARCCGVALPRRTCDFEKETLDRIRVQRLLTRLSGRDREIVELTYLHDLSSDQVGEMLGMASSSVRCRLLRLRRGLASAMAEPSPLSRKRS